MIACCESTTRVLPYDHFLSQVFKDADIDLSKEMDFEAPNTYDTYDDQSMGQMKFEKTLDGSWIRKVERAQPQGQGQTHLGVEKESEIKEMEDGVHPQGGLNPQSGHQQRGPKLDIPPIQTEVPSQTRGVQFESTFFKPMMIELAFIDGPSTQPLYIEPSFSRPTFIEPTYTEIPQPQTPSTPNHAPQMDLSAQINSLGTCMEELAMVNDT